MLTSFSVRCPFLLSIKISSLKTPFYFFNLILFTLKDQVIPTDSYTSIKFFFDYVKVGIVIAQEGKGINAR